MLMRNDSFFFESERLDKSYTPPRARVACSARERKDMGRSPSSRVRVFLCAVFPVFIFQKCFLVFSCVGFSGFLEFRFAWLFFKLFPNLKVVRILKLLKFDFFKF
jgi:hypothetical protein